MSIIIFTLVLFMYQTFVWAAPTDRQFTVEYTEPTMNADGTALDDLAGTMISTDVIGDNLAGQTRMVPAATQTGGGMISESLCIPIPDDTTATHINVHVTAVDLSGNESMPEPAVPIQWPVVGNPDCSAPDTTAPAAPTGVTVSETP